MGFTLCACRDKNFSNHFSARYLLSSEFVNMNLYFHSRQGKSKRVKSKYVSEKYLNSKKLMYNEGLLIILE